MSSLASNPASRPKSKPLSTGKIRIKRATASEIRSALQVKKVDIRRAKKALENVKKRYEQQGGDLKVKPELPGSPTFRGTDSLKLR